MAKPKDLRLLSVTNVLLPLMNPIRYGLVLITDL
jgi:hypothetical protein